MTKLKIGLVGLGKIARDEHVPAIAVHPEAELIAVASRNAKAEGVANYADLESMLNTIGVASMDQLGERTGYRLHRPLSAAKVSVHCSAHGVVGGQACLSRKAPRRDAFRG